MIPLQIKGLRVKYDKAGPEVLKGIDLSLERNDFLVVIGPSGAGKSTLIRCINRLVEPTSGEILLFGTDVTKLNRKELMTVRRSVGMVFQEFRLIERMSVLENVLCGRLGYISTLRSLFGWYHRSDLRMAIEMLDRVGLSDFLDKRVDELSGGQRQRVGVARALVQSPRILLLDEPTSNLDPRIGYEIMCLIKQISQESTIPILCGLHNVELALEFSNKIIGLKDGIKVFEGLTDRCDRNRLEKIYGGDIW